METPSVEILCPTCPLCGSEPPWIVPSMAQAFCPSDECDVLCWSPWDTKEANLHDMHEAVVTGLPGPLQDD
jgi:hypothetical protein